MQKLLENKKARKNYEIMERLEAGIELFGFEVKSLREKKGSLSGAHVTVRGGEAYLLNMNVPAYQPKNTPEWYRPDRNRRLLLKRKELATLAGKERQPGLTIVPLSVYNNKGIIKVEIAVVRGSTKKDKREKLKRKAIKRDVERDFKEKLR